MLASSKNDTGDGKSFIAAEHFRAICEGGKLTLHDNLHIDYPQGWVEIVEDLIQEIKDSKVRIFSVESDEQLLRVEFLPKTQQSGLQVFRAVYSAMIRSRSACYECGKRVAFQENSGRFDLCTSCRMTAAKKGKTGTWLDKYV